MFQERGFAGKERGACLGGDDDVVIANDALEEQSL
jgi:hypothetical protein